MIEITFHELDVHDLLLNMQTLVENRAQQHSFMAVLHSVEKLMAIPFPMAEIREELSDLTDEVGKLGVVLELLSARNSQAVDPGCRQLRDKVHFWGEDLADPTGLPVTRWDQPPNAEWETLNVTRIDLTYSCETLLLCMIREDLLTPDPEDPSLRFRLNSMAKVIKDILHQTHWTHPSVQFADNQIHSFEKLETETKDIFLKASESTFDHKELSISVSLLKGMLYFLHAYKGALLREELEENARHLSASSCIQPPGLPVETVTPGRSTFKTVLADLDTTDAWSAGRREESPEEVSHGVS